MFPSSKNVVLPSLQAMRKSFDAQELLDTSVVLEIIAQAYSLLQQEPNVLQIPTPCCIFGDIHGQYYDLMNLAAEKNLEDPYSGTFGI